MLDWPPKLFFPSASIRFFTGLEITFFCKIKMIVIMTILKCCHPCTVSQGMTFFKERDILLTDTYVQVYCLHTYDVIFSFICVVQYFFYYLSILGTHFYLFYANTTLIDAQPHPILFIWTILVHTYIYLIANFSQKTTR